MDELNEQSIGGGGKEDERKISASESTYIPSLDGRRASKG
jgi:hypothetical protein